MNAVVLADGWIDGGRDGARDKLAAFWTALGKLMPAGMVSALGSESIGLSPSGRMLFNLTSLFAPSQLNPMALNPLRDLLASLVDFERLRSRSPFKLFVGATQANTGKLRVFREHELSVDVLLASACLPKLHHPVDIDGVPYWDGGYSANPAVFPLFYDCESTDVLLVLLSPLLRTATPRTVDEIDDRITELAFSTTFIREMQTFARAAQFSALSADTAGSLERKLASLRFHLIDPQDVPSLQRTDTKALAHRPFLEFLREQGQGRATEWLARHGADIGKRSTVDLLQSFL